MATWGVRIFAEYEVEVPLWPSGNSPSPLPISPELRRDLAAWNVAWMELDDHPTYDDSNDDWSEWEPGRAWNREGYELVRRLRAELGADVEIEYFDYVTDENVTIA
jgi:hypothetical protein